MTDVATITAARFCVLVVCPNAVVRAELLNTVAALSGIPLHMSVDSGLAAARLCMITHPDAVVIDAVDPGAGHDVLGIACASPASTIIVFTARRGRRDAARLIEAGATAVIAKGDGAELHSVISALVAEKAA